MDLTCPSGLASSWSNLFLFLARFHESQRLLKPAVDLKKLSATIYKYGGGKSPLTIYTLFERCLHDGVEDFLQRSDLLSANLYKRSSVIDAINRSKFTDNWRSGFQLPAHRQSWGDNGSAETFAKLTDINVDWWVNDTVELTACYTCVFCEDDDEEMRKKTWGSGSLRC